jgi:hypothetical protein
MFESALALGGFSRDPRSVARFNSLFFVAAFALPLGGCLSGQTGSPDCVGPTECLCDTLYGGGNVLRVRVDSVEGDVLRATVTENVVGIYGSIPVAPGTRVAGTLGVEQPCAPEQRSSSLGGADLLVNFGFTGEPTNGHFVWAVPWSETLDFGADHLLTSDEAASVFASPEACLSRFPSSPPPPCNDTIEGGPCTVAQVRARPAFPSAALVSALLFGSVARRLIRRRSSA